MCIGVGESGQCHAGQSRHTNRCGTGGKLFEPVNFHESHLERCAPGRRTAQRLRYPQEAFMRFIQPAFLNPVCVLLLALFAVDIGCAADEIKPTSSPSPESAPARPMPMAESFS